MEEKNIFKEIGLTGGEVELYFSLLNKGTQTASQLAKNTNLDRSNIYRILKRLEEKNLAFSLVINKIKHFSGTRPERIMELYQEEISKLKEREGDIKEFIKSSRKLSESKISESLFAVEVHEGIEGAKRMLENLLTLKRGEIIYSIGKEFELSEYPGIKYWFENFKKRRARKGIKFRAIYNIHKDAKPPITKHTEVRYTNLSNIKETAEMIFFKDILLIFIMKEKNPKVVLIESKEITNSMKSYFEVLWMKAKIPKNH